MSINNYDTVAGHKDGESEKKVQQDDRNLAGQQDLWWAFSYILEGN